MHIDTEGNKYYIDVDNNVHLISHIDNKEKIIGKIEKDTYYKTEKESDIFRKTNAWSINLTVLDKVNFIEYTDSKFKYTITKEEALKVGDYFHFKNSTEKKIYVPIVHWNKVKL